MSAMSKPRAIVYVDGFNLYKGQLEQRPGNKWVDLWATFSELLSDYEVIGVHLFTARVKGRMTPEDPQAPDRQDAYIRALRATGIVVHDDSIFAVHHGMAREWVDGKEKPPFTWHHVYKVHEKDSDVKLATQLLLDSMDDLADAYVVVSSDSDLSRPIEAAVARFGARVGVVYPRNEKTKLLEAAGIAFSLYLHPSVVARNQMPAVVRAGTRLVRRPAAWKEQGPAEAGP